MIKAIEIDAEEMEEILGHLPKELRDKLEIAIGEKPDSGIHILKKFIEQFDEDNMADNIISFTFASLYKKITLVAHAVHEEAKKSGKKGLTTNYMAQIVVQCLADEAEKIEKAMKKHGKECKKESCQAHH